MFKVSHNKYVSKKFNTVVKGKYFFVLTGLFLLILVTGLWIGLENQEKANHYKAVEAEAKKITEIINVDLHNRIKSLKRIVKRWEKRGGTPKSEFIDDIQAHIIDDPGYQAIGWVDKTFYVRWIVPFIGNEAALNLNLAFEEKRRVALEKVKRTGITTLTSPITLVQGGKGFLLYVPIYINGEFGGIISTVFRTQEWLNYILHENMNSQEEVNFHHLISMDEQTIYSKGTWKKESIPLGEVTVESTIYGKKFKIQTRPTNSFFNKSRTIFPNLVFIVGVILSLLISVVIYLVQKANRAVQLSEANQTRLDNEITIRKKTETSLNIAKNKYQRLLEEIGDKFIIYSHLPEEGGLTYLSGSVEDIIGLNKEDCIGNSWTELINWLPETLKSTQYIVKQQIEGKLDFHQFEMSFYHADSTLRTLQVSNHPVKDNLGKVIAIDGIIEDITERKQSEEKLKLASSVFTHARESIAITDNTGTIIDVNDTFISTTGYSREELIGQNPRLLKSGRQPSEFYDEMWKVLLEEGYWSGELWNRRKNGEVYAEIKTISAVHDEQRNTTNYVALGNDITPMKKHQDQLERIAHYDVLTHLPNRSLLTDRLSQAMLQCNRHNKSLAVVFLDLDGFKQVNDINGHDVGDDLLVALSIRMQDALRENDSLARIGGDEFVAVLTDLATVEDCEPVLERLLLAASDPVTIDDIVLNVSASIGVTLYPQDNVDGDQLMRHADQAMYAAKESGKNCYYLFDAAQGDVVKAQRENLEAIRRALDNNQFVLHYQPKVNMRTGTVVGVEALIRWQHPERGLLNPIDFLPVIENNPMSIEMGEWVINTALTQISQWQTMGLQIPISTSVNIAAVQLQQPNFTERLTILLSAHPDVEPCYLELEVLETSALEDVHHVSTIMKECMVRGIKFALDDFGTGYSSLTYLRRLPANSIKIDQTFVRDMLIDPEDFAIVEGVIALAKSFKRDVIAEGVETVEHGTALLQLGCEMAQGYGIAKPMSASDIPTWIRDWKPDVSWQT
jgi:diguanylate cyclase (GGDEF)-like protein/PAS domain S-box-containing protein